MPTLGDVNSPAYVNAATARQAASLQVVRDLAGGTPRMRECGVTYLPMEAGESTTAYSVRLARSLLFNTFVKVREGLIGIALKTNPEPQSDVPSIIRDQLEDIDLAGTHGDVFWKEAFRDVIQEGHVHILVDMQPPVSANSTRADEIASGRRPYCVKYKKDEAVNWKQDQINGETVLTQITFKECATEDAGRFGEREVVRYRVLMLPKVSEKTRNSPAIYGPMEWELYEKRTIGENEVLLPVDGTSFRQDETKPNLSRIPVVTIYARRKAFMESDPPLLDLAYLNIGHWQQWSDLNCQLRMLVPILHIKGDIVGNTEATAEGAQKPQLKLGPGTAIQTDKDGDVKYVSADATATQGMSDSLANLEQRMSAVGLSVISPKPDRTAQAATATEKVMDQDERISELASWLRNLKDGIESILQLFANYQGLPDGGSVILGFDEPNAADQQAVTAINAPKTVPMQDLPMVNTVEGV